MQNIRRSVTARLTATCLGRCLGQCLGRCLGLVLTLAIVSLPANAVEERTLNNGQLILQDIPEIPPSLAARLNQYQNVRSASFQDWAEDDSSIYIRTRFGDVTQIHRVYGPGGTRQQLTFFDEPVGQVIRPRNGSRLAFTMDSGGSEESQIFLLDPDDGKTKILSDGQSRNRLLKWNDRGTQFAYQSTRRNGRTNDIWIMDPNKPEATEIVVEAADGEWWAPADFSRDGKLLLVQQFVSVTDSRIYLLDLKSREMVLLAGGGEFESANRAIEIDRNGKGFYMISNSRGVGAELTWKSLIPEEPPVYITTNISWDISEFALSKDGRRGAFVSNEGGISRLYLLNTKTLRYKRIGNLPVGLIFNLSFHPDNRKLAMNLNTAQSPSDVYVMELGRSATEARRMTRWTFSEVGGLRADNFVAPDLIHYPTFDLSREKPRKIPAFVYRPKGKGPHPVIISIHGGPEGQYRPTFSSTFQMWLAELGAAVIAPNVRGSVGYGNYYVSLDDGLLREDAVRDIGALLDWIREQKDLDENRVAVFGGSYGGYMVLASAVHYSDRLKAAIDVVGISNFVTFLENTEEYRRDMRRMEYGDEREPEMRAFLEQASPLSHVDKINVPMLVVHGENDPRVPASEAEQIVEALRLRGLPVWYMNALNEGHGYQKKDNKDTYQQAMIMFLKKFLIDETKDP